MNAVWVEAKAGKPPVQCFKNSGCMVTDPGGQLLKVSAAGEPSKLFCVECGPDAIQAVAFLGGTIGKPKTATTVAKAGMKGKGK